MFGLDTTKTPQAVEQQLRDWLDSHYPGAVAKVEAVPEFSKAYPLYTQLKNEQGLLRSYRTYERETQKTAHIRVKLCTKVPAIQHLEALETKHLAKLQRHYHAGLDRTCGVAFITFRSVEALNKVKASYSNTEGVFFQLHEACSPADVNWNYVNSSPLHGACFKLALTLLFIILFLLVLTPTNFINFFTSIYEQGVGSAGAGLVGEYLPTVLLLVYQQVLLPIAIDFLVSTEHHVSKSEAAVSSMTKFLLFNSFYVFFLQFFGMQFIKIVDLAIYGDLNSWVGKVANSLTSTGQFFTIFMVQMALLGNGLDLLQAGRLIVIKIAQWQALTQEDKEKAYVVRSM